MTPKVTESTPTSSNAKCLADRRNNLSIPDYRSVKIRSLMDSIQVAFSRQPSRHADGRPLQRYQSDGVSQRCKAYTGVRLGRRAPWFFASRQRLTLWALRWLRRIRKVSRHNRKRLRQKSARLSSPMLLCASKSLTPNFVVSAAEHSLAKRNTTAV